MILMIRSTINSLNILVWTSEENNSNIRSSHTTNLVNHLINCDLQPDSVKQRAIEEKGKASTLSPHKNAARVPALTVSHVAALAVDSAPCLQGTSGSIPVTDVPSPWPSMLDPHLRYHPYPTQFRSVSPVSSNLGHESIGPASSFDSLNPSDSISVATPPISQPNSHPSSRVGRSLSRRGSVPLNQLLPPAEYPPWTSDRKKNFESA